MVDTDPPQFAITFRWHDGALTPIDDCDVVESALAVADSFLVQHDRVLALDLHRRRFAESAAAHGYTDARDLDHFWLAALGLIPAAGAWFPRFELVLERSLPRLHFRLRPAPVLHERVRLWTYRGPELRLEPSVKGPDLAAMMRLRTAAQHAGADEAVILDDDVVSDGATSALLWWRGETLCLPPLALPRVASVTARSIRTIAAATAVDVVEEPAPVASLEGCEIWAVNALHGIRVCEQWIDGPKLSVLPGRDALWRARLTALRRPLHDPGDAAH